MGSLARRNSNDTLEKIMPLYLEAGEGFSSFPFPCKEFLI